MIAIPKPAIGALALVLLGAAGWYYWPAAEGENWLGYVEAETIYVAAPVSGRLAARPVERGASVAATGTEPDCRQATTLTPARW